MSVWAALAGGFFGTLVLTTALSAGSQLRITRMDIPFLLGTACTDNRTRARVVGYALHFVAGLVFALAYYAAFGEKVRETKRKLLEFLIAARRAGKQVVGYGAPAKGNTLLVYCGIRTDFLDYTVDRSPHKAGKYLPGSRIPIRVPEAIYETRPDYVLILPWNLREEIAAQMAGIREWGGHGIGRKLHEAPSVSHVIQPSNPLRLTPGMVFTIEPMVNLGVADWTLLDDGWTVVTNDGQLSAQFEHTVAITANGPRILTAA